MQPNILVVTRFVIRGLLLWVGARLLGSAVLALAGADPLHLNLSFGVLFVLICIALGLADIHRRHERALLENLGVSRFARVVFFALPALVGECAIAIVGSIGG